METSERSEPEITLASLAPILKLDKLQIQSVTRNYACAADQAMPRYMTLHLLLADLLERLAFLKPSQRQAILANYDQDIDENGSQWTTLAFADGNWVTWSGYSGWLDLTSGDTITMLPAMPVETIGYNLVVLYDRAVAQLLKRKSHAEEHRPGSSDQQRDVR